LFIARVDNEISEKFHTTINEDTSVESYGIAIEFSADVEDPFPVTLHDASSEMYLNSCKALMDE
jgi:hypothetical protein